MLQVKDIDLYFFSLKRKSILKQPLNNKLVIVMMMLEIGCCFVTS